MKNIAKIIVFLLVFIGIGYVLISLFYKPQTSFIGKLTSDNLRNSISKKNPDNKEYLTDISLPEGFRIHYYAKNIPNARSMTISDSGIVYVGSRSEGKIYAVVDENGDMEADSVVTVMSGLNSPNGVVWYEGDLFVAEIDQILRFEDIDSTYNRNLAYQVVYDALPNDPLHGWKYIDIGPDNKLYVPIGANCNVCNTDNTDYATLNRMNLDGSDFEVIARGIRNTVGFTWHPETKELYFTDNGRDHMGDNLPPDELNVVSEVGEHFGYPHCHGKDVLDPEFGSEGDCDEYTSALVELGPHVAALGITFYGGDMFPNEFKNKALIAEHGSWNRSEKIGYRIMQVDVKTGTYSEFATGWLLDNEQVWGRPVDLLQLKDGSLLVSDDYSGSIYRIIYE